MTPDPAMIGEGRDEVPVAEAVYDMVEPGGALVLVGYQAQRRPVPPSPGPPPIPHDEIEELVRKYLGPTRRAGRPRHPRELLRERSPDGVFWDWPGDTEVMLARKRPKGDWQLAVSCSP